MGKPSEAPSHANRGLVTKVKVEVDVEKIIAQMKEQKIRKNEGGF